MCRAGQACIPARPTAHTRSGRMKSATAVPSFRNSLLETTAKSIATPRCANSSVMAARTLLLVPAMVTLTVVSS